MTDLTPEEVKQVQDLMKRDGFKLFKNVLNLYQDKFIEELIATDDKDEANKIRGKINIIRNFDTLVKQRLKVNSRSHEQDTINL